MDEKVCNKCGIIKKIEEFRKVGNKYRGECKDCAKKYNRKYQEEHGKEVYEKRKDKAKLYREQNKEKNKIYQKEYYKNHKEEHKKYSKEYNKIYVRPQVSIDRHKEKTKEWKQNNKEHIREYARKYDNEHRKEKIKNNRDWRNKNKDKVKKYQQRDYKKRANDPLLRLQRNTRNMLNDAFRKHKYKKSLKSKEILGCDVDVFVEYLLQTFKNTYGYEWDKIEPVHIDHIIPLVTANSKEDVIKLCHYTNLQLLKAEDNLEKNDRLNWKPNKNSEL